jgi:hypothetical protein
MLQLHFTRAKLFIRQTEEGEKRFMGAPGTVVNAPNWVKDTEGYKYGIKDKSIRDLTPPKVGESPVAVEEVKEPEPPAPPPVAEETKPEPTDEELEQASVEAARKTKLPAGAGVVRASTAKVTR